MNRVYGAVLLLALVDAAQAAAAPIPQCAPHNEMADTLFFRTQESLLMDGIAYDLSRAELYASPGGGWSIVLTSMFTGKSCIITWGTNLRMRAKQRGAQR